MKRIVKYLKYYQKQAILAPLFKWLEAIFDLCIPIIISNIIDNGILKSDYAFLTQMVGILILLAILGGVVSITAQYFAAKVSSRLGTTLREKLFAHIQSFSFTNLDQIQEATILNRLINDTWQVQNSINLLLRLALRSPFIVLGSLVLAFFIQVKMGIIFVITIPLIMTVVVVVTKICIPRYEKIQNQKDDLLDKTQENLEGIRNIRAFGLENRMEREFKQENSEYAKEQQKVSKITSFSNPCYYIIINFAIIAILLIGGKQVNLGILSQGQIVALYHYMAQILTELLKLTNLLQLLPKTIASARRIEALFQQENTMLNGHALLDDENVVLEFEKVSLTYQNRTESTLEEISFQAKTGQIIGIIGGTGSGKTSILHLIPRFYDVSSGEIKINGKNMKEYDIKNIRSNIAIVTQKKAIFRGTIRENVTFGKEDLTEEKIEEALEIAQAKEFIIQKEKGIEEEVQENGGNLSGGQKQRLTIARAIARNPKILLLDDSMSALDLATDKEVRQALNLLKKDKLLFMVSERISAVQNLDKILVLDQGKIVGQGNHQELLKNCKIYQEIYTSQLQKEER